ncbi:MAG: hypothetical protein ACRYFS_23955 [Janthinobacterium lividum]
MAKLSRKRGETERSSITTKPSLMRPLKPRRIPSLAVLNGREIVFRHPWGSRLAGFILAAVLLWPVALSVTAVLAGKPYGAYAVFVVPGFGFFVLYLLSALGPNEMRFDLEKGTYRLRRFKPWPGRYAATWGMGIPLWEQHTEGPVSDILRLRVQEVYWKQNHSFCIHVVWRDPRRTPAFLTVLRSRADAEALMMQVAEAAGVLAFPGLEPAVHGG